MGITGDQVVQFYRALAKTLVETKSRVVERHLKAMLRHLVSQRRTMRCMRATCGAGDSFQAVNASGDIFPCGRATQSPQLRLGNVHEPHASLAAPAQTNLRVAQIRGRRPEHLADCDSCAYRQLCQAGCSVQALERYGTIRSKSPECEFYLELYPFLMHWLSFDVAAFEHIASAGYFDGAPVLFSRDLLAN